MSDNSQHSEPFEFDQDQVTTEPQNYQTSPPEPQTQQSHSPQQEEVFLQWEAPSRPFKKRNRKYYTTIVLIVVLISLILLFAGQFLLIAVMIAISFLGYALSAIPPEMIVNKVTTYGVRNNNTLYHWDYLGRFWFTSKYNQRLLNIETSRIPNQIILVINPEDEPELTQVFSSILVYEAPQPTLLDKAATWLEEKIPLDSEA
jgi:hypothetical protein